MPDVQRPVAMVAVSEKGYLSLELVAHGEGRHSSMPPTDSAIALLVSAVDRLQRNPFSPRLTLALRQNLETLAPETPFPQRLLLSNLWLTAPLVVRGLAMQTEARSRHEEGVLVRASAREVHSKPVLRTKPPNAGKGGPRFPRRQGA